DLGARLRARAGVARFTRSGIFENGRSCRTLKEGVNALGTVLLVDDDAAVRGLAAQVLAAEGYVVVQAAGPAEALAICERGDPTALVAADDGARTSYADLAADVDALAGKLRAAGVERGDRVALVVPEGPPFVRLLLAIAAAGAAAAPLNPAYTRDEFAFYLDD